LITDVPDAVERLVKPAGTKGKNTDDLLTNEELALVEDLGRIVERFGRVIGQGHARDSDVGDAMFHILALQRMVLAQAAARAYPMDFRLMGEDKPVGSRP
jgi:hypothetical protein